MAKFRRTHSPDNSKRSGKSAGGFSKVRMFLLIAILFGLIAYGLKYLPSLSNVFEENSPDKENSYEPKYQDPATQIRHFLPTTKLGKEVHHTFYSLSYSEKDEQAEWVAYELTRDQLNGSRVPRTDWFEEDKSVSTKSAHFEDYRSSGYTKGHLVPAADMAFSKQAMDETFLMSNISPQLRAFNGGIWRELEEDVRDWVRQHGRLYIISGPVLNEQINQQIGRNKVSVPKQFYKILLLDEPGNEQAIAFLIPNERSEKPLSDYTTTIDEIESLTKIDFFGSVFNNSNIEKKVESAFDVKYWKIDPVRFDRRIKSWNNQ